MVGSNDVEAIVVGSGFGGAVAACRLSQAGVKVRVIERGRRYEAGDLPALPVESELLPDLRRWNWHSDRGLWEVLDLEEVISVQAAGYGGGSLVYANVHLRPPSDLFDEYWPAALRGDRLDPYYDLAAAMLDVAPITETPEFGATIKADQLRKAARDLGRFESVFHPPLAINFRSVGLNAFGQQQGRCVGCGRCCSGCPYGAKNILPFNYLAVAEANGAEVLTQCEVVGVRQVVNGWQVECVSSLTNQRLEFECRYLFLCAGSIHSTKLLKQARLDHSSRAVKSRVGLGYFPGADAVGVVFDTEHPQHPSSGPAITTAVLHRDPHSDGKSFFMIQDGGYGPELERLIGLFRSPLWLGRNRLSTAGSARVARSPGKPARPPPVGDPEAKVPSPLDAVLSAFSGGAFHGITPPDLQRSIRPFLNELQRMLLLPRVVENTIDRTLAERRARHWLLRRLRHDNPVVRALERTLKWLAYRELGGPDELARAALLSLFSLGGAGREQLATDLLGYDARRAERRTMLLAMGRDATPGVLHYDRLSDRVIADLDLFHLAPRYRDEELLMTDIAEALGGELRVNPAWAFLGKPITVHSQGGCRMSDLPDDGVTNAEGEVHGCSGLHVLDASVLCRSVGVNPSATILAVAERALLSFIRRHTGNEAWPRDDHSAGARQYERHQQLALRWAERARRAGWSIRPPATTGVPFRTEPIGIAFSERMVGYYHPTDAVPSKDAEFRALETRGRPEYPLELKLTARIDNLAAFFEDLRHQMDLSGTIRIRLPHEPEAVSYPVTGRLELFVNRSKPYGLSSEERRRAQARITGKAYTTQVRRRRSGMQRLMRYELQFHDASGEFWHLRGYKRLRRDPAVDPWRETSCLLVDLRRGPQGGERLVGAGAVHVALPGFLYQQLQSLHVTGSRDPARVTWALATFASYFFGTLQQVYLPEGGALLDALFRPLATTRRHAHRARHKS